MPSFDLDRVLRETFVASFEHFSTLGSTNDRAKEAAGDCPDFRAPTGHYRQIVGEGTKMGLSPSCGPLPLLIVADRQTAGRGRGGNAWWTGEGSLAFSLLLGSEHLPQKRRSALVSLAAGVAVVETVAPLVPDRPIGIHWPNDVMVGDRKLSGILIEVLPDGRQVVGIGVNVNNTAADAPDEIQPLVATLRDLTGRSHDRTDILVSLLQHLAGQLSVLRSSPEQIASRTDSLCLQRGRMLTVCQGEQTIIGRCEGIAPDGALRLETSDGERLVYSGVVRMM